VLDSSSLAPVPPADGNQVVASVARVDGSVMTLKDTQGAVLTVQANSPNAAATAIPGTRVLVDLVELGSPGSGKAVR